MHLANGNPITNIELDGHMFVADGGGSITITTSTPSRTLPGELCSPGVYGSQFGVTSGGTTTKTSSGSQPTPVTKISSRVSASGPVAAHLQATWQWATQQYEAPTNAIQEYNLWVTICNNSPYTGSCNPDMHQEFPIVQPMVSNPSGFSAQSFMQGFKLLVLGGIVRSLVNPASMVGATLDEIRALIPSG